jgi:hypothetical protein
MKRALILLTSLGLLVACDELQPKDKPKEPEPPSRVVHHFDPIARSEGNLAVDTATGQMCKTWDWACTKPGYYNNYTKEWVENSAYGVNCSAITSMPTCESISKKQ